VPILVKIDQEMRPWKYPQTDWLANWFYNLSHAICYSYETYNNRLRISCEVRTDAHRHRQAVRQLGRI